MREKTEWKECIKPVWDEWEKEENGVLMSKEKNWISTSISDLTEGSWTYTASAYGGCTAGVNPPSFRSRSHTWGWCLCTLQLHAIIYHLLLSCTGVLSMALHSPQQQCKKLLSSCALSNTIKFHFVLVYFTTEERTCTTIAPLRSPVIRVNIHIWYLRLAQKRLFLKGDSLSPVLRPALAYMRISPSPSFSDNCHILFKVEALGGLTKKKQGASHANLRTHTCTQASTVGNPGTITGTSVPEIRLQIPAV